ncbi:Calcium-dependent protein kinase [Corchorus olitorius]|uniref:Calcium-dependent protein kinase n=1 Tax=Corchorus olitorius TaxID=93759 RepID=A0A1R3G6B6_9ROSI|nr:Calcium-dependent protein kinase [Corchorus olitorius]
MVSICSIVEVCLKRVYGDNFERRGYEDEFFSEYVLRWCESRVKCEKGWLWRESLPLLCGEIEDRKKMRERESPLLRILSVVIQCVGFLRGKMVMERVVSSVRIGISIRLQVSCLFGELAMNLG